MRPIPSNNPVAYAAGQRCIARAAYALDVGGVRSRESLEVVQRVVNARANDPTTERVRHIDLPVRHQMVRITCVLPPQFTIPVIDKVVGDDGEILFLTCDEVRAIRPALKRLF